MSKDSISRASFFSGENLRFVAWLDISGFKKLMKANPDEALKVIKEFFKIGFWQLPRDDQPQREVAVPGLDGLFVSDCAIIWTNLVSDEQSCIDQFRNILEIVKKINEKVLLSEVMRRNRIMLSTSIAFGKFCSIKTKDHDHIQKNMIFGPAYIDAYTDNLDNLDPGLCRIVKKNLPELISNGLNSSLTHDNLLAYVHQDEDGIFFYWNCRTFDEIETFRANYRQARDAKYQEMYEALSIHYRKYT